MRLGRRLAKVLAWGLVLIVLIAAGAAWFAYALVTDSDTAARLIRAQAARFLPRSTIEMGKVNVGILKGEVTVNQIHVLQRIDGQSFLTSWVPWLRVKLDPRQAIHGRFEPREVVISQPTLRLCQRADGTWNLQGLIADPWPAPAIKNAPPILVNNGTVELIGVEEPEAGSASAAGFALKVAHAGAQGRDAELVRTADASPSPRIVAGNRGASPRAGDGKSPEPPRELSPSGRPGPAGPALNHGVAVLRDVWLKIEQAEGGRLQFEGTARGDLFEKLRLEGSIDPRTGDTILQGELAGLTLSENLRRRLPPKIGASFDALALKRGEIDLEVHRLAIHPAAPPDRRFDYDVLARLDGGVWECPALPFPVNDLSASLPSTTAS